MNQTDAEREIESLLGLGHTPSDDEKLLINEALARIMNASKQDWIDFRHAWITTFPSGAKVSQECQGQQTDLIWMPDES